MGNRSVTKCYVHDISGLSIVHYINQQKVRILKRNIREEIRHRKIGITLSRHFKTLFANIFLTIRQKIRIIGTRLTCDEILLTLPTKLHGLNL